MNVFAMARAGCLQLHVPIKHQNKSKVWTIHPLNDQGSASRVQDQDSHGSTGLDLEATLADALNLYFLSRNVPAVG